MNAEQRTGTAATLPVKCISPSADNVHAAERRGDAAFDGLVGSVRANGLIHRIVVRPDGDPADGRYVIVDGHRRFEAAKAVGMEEVPVEIRDFAPAEALAVTVAANVQRLENDPVLEADAIGKMLKAGMSAREIAAAVGKGEGYVARRARLTSLAGPWRDFARRVRCTVDLLEKVAAHETAVQERVAAGAGLEDYVEDGGEPCGWSEFESAFRAQVRRLDEAAFDTSACAKCPSNTACHAFLFDWMEDEEGNAARCQDVVCYARRNNAAVDAEVSRLRLAGTPAVEVGSKWAIPEYWDIACSRDRKHPKAYVWEQDGLRNIAWGAAKKAAAARREARTDDERREEREEKRRRRFVKSAREKIRAAIAERAKDVEAFKSWAGSNYDELAGLRLERELNGYWLSDGFVDDVARVWPELEGVCDLEFEEADALSREIERADKPGSGEGGEDAE